MHLAITEQKQLMRKTGNKIVLIDKIESVRILTQILKVN